MAESLNERCSRAEDERDAALQELRAVVAELDQLKATATRAAQAVVAVVENEAIDAEQTAIACREIAINVLTPVRDREIAEAKARIAEAQARLRELVGTG